MERYTNTILNKQGKPVAGAVVTVTTYPGNEPATIYAADGGQSVKSVTSDQNGRFAFYAADGHYNLSISGKHIDPFTITDIVLNDPNDDLSLGALQPVKDDLDALQLPDYAALRAYKGPRKSVFVTGAGIAGMFVRDDTDTASADNGGTVIVAGDKRFKRVFDGTVDVRWFGVTGAGTDEAGAFNAAATFAALSRIPLCMAGLTIRYGGGFYCTTAGARVIWRNGGVKLTDGAKASAAFIISGSNCVDIRGMAFDGNRLNVSQNNAGLFVVEGVKHVRFDDISINDLRRYGINVGGTTGCENVHVSRVRATDIGVQSEGASLALGEVIKIENSKNVVVDGFKCTNPSSTGDGQVLKVFHCENVDVFNFDITDASPSKVYPAISLVRNRNIKHRNIKIVGACQVAIENNANINQSYDDIVTEGTEKAMILGTDGAAKGDRHSENTVIRNWIDTSTQALAFNLFGAKGLSMSNVSTPQTINISRDAPGTDRRSEDLTLERVTCAVLNTYLVMGQKRLDDVTITGAWANTSPGVTRAINTTYASYNNSAQTDVFLAREVDGGDAVQISGTLAASGGTLAYRAPATVTADPFSGEVLVNSIFTASGSSQWSKLHFDFYDYGTPAVLKTTRQSGSVARPGIALTVSRAAKTLTFTNSETSDIRVDARIVFVNRSAA